MQRATAAVWDADAVARRRAPAGTPAVALRAAGAAACASAGVAAAGARRCAADAACADALGSGSIAGFADGSRLPRAPRVLAGGCVAGRAASVAAAVLADAAAAAATTASAAGPCFSTGRIHLAGASQPAASQRLSPATWSLHAGRSLRAEEGRRGQPAAYCRASGCSRSHAVVAVAPQAALPRSAPRRSRRSCSGAGVRATAARRGRCVRAATQSAALTQPAAAVSAAIRDV